MSRHIGKRDRGGTSTRPEVHAIAAMLQSSPNVEIPKRKVGAALGLRCHQLESLLSSVSEIYPQVGEDDRKLIWVVHEVS